ncbi:MAG: hypothetical protein A3G32_00745 [Deltaproteobacteria bacterium RIFCSPLOWO2_12_FULL_40_28]|nr:MAG: hypothetical protein A3C45_09630 [Deltaproteobacteria bacterium RIFCSPHIGHO2_02_FULL_40_28]OGQ19868.1 MAG: hypothetical protein A3E27_06580 [Deltaproteobacteria bacterium RIFCSPHIGHO2_12_FULL_40_32]OGQ39627.1 MAG: hypothetical protein A3I69_06010 [Deltaproteobacteria bacterium RIFCSPLOWO2_02_FULL_40_36]OGQ52883.1 MAG: hypothetical protein A3G32_00745 [Deltaproteobacteria bacterium RIFCSPLOWO2_12_FULL_40_28]
MSAKTKSQLLIIGSWLTAIDQLKTQLKKDDFDITVVTLEEAISSMREADYDCVLILVDGEDVTPEISLSGELRKTYDNLPIFVIGKKNHWEPAVSFMKQGVTDYLPYSESKDCLKKNLSNKIRVYHMTKRVFQGDGVSRFISPFEGMVGNSERMQENFRMIQSVSKSNATVLITGESGTGKELVAKAVHHISNRSQYRFVDLNCGAIPRDLLENELFGHEKGSFTGAHKRYLGSFEAAHRGTLFLDEISEMDPLLQVKLLRVLQERSFMRIGGTEKIDVDVRIIAATNKNLHDSIEKGLFREDLFYRLNVVNINIPALRERREDILLIATHFLEFHSAKNNRIFIDFATDAMETLINYDWPGNVRELENTIERIVVLHDDSQVKLKYLPKHIQKVNRSIALSEVAKPATTDETNIIPLDDLEKQAIELALLKFQGNISVVAKKLKIGQATLYRKVKKYGLNQLHLQGKPS